MLHLCKLETCTYISLAAMYGLTAIDKILVAGWKHTSFLCYSMGARWFLCFLGPKLELPRSSAYSPYLRRLWPHWTEHQSHHHALETRYQLHNNTYYCTKLLTQLHAGDSDFQNCISHLRLSRMPLGKLFSAVVRYWDCISRRIQLSSYLQKCVHPMRWYEIRRRLKLSDVIVFIFMAAEQDAIDGL